MQNAFPTHSKVFGHPKNVFASTKQVPTHEHTPTSGVFVQSGQIF